MKVNFISISDNPLSLHIVKAIKEATNDGLKESKDLYEGFRYGKPTTIEIPDEKVSKFIETVKEGGLICVAETNRKNTIKRFYKAQSECPDIDDIIEFLGYNFHITALCKDGQRYMITDCDNDIVGMPYGEVWKKRLNIEDFSEFEINHVKFSTFSLTYYEGDK